MQSRVYYESFSGIASSSNPENRPFDDYSVSIPPALMKQDVEEEVTIMVAALEASDLSRMEAQNTGDSLLALSTNGNCIDDPLRKITNSGPPKRFRRRGAMWASITRRTILLLQESTGSPPR